MSDAIAVLGANGQVGSEVCISLVELGVPVVAVVRSRVGTALLARAGVPCRVGDPSRREQLADLLAGCGTVADFSLPTGLPSEIERGAVGLIEAVMSAGPRRFVYMSTTMAFGMPPGEQRYKPRLVARTQYAHWKRKAESAARALRGSTRTSVFRLGQVHGELQAATREATRRVLGAPALRVADAETDIVFAATIALALAATHRDECPAGDYSLVDDPAWRLDAFYRFVATELGAPTTIEPVPSGSGATSWAAPRAWLAANREALVAHLLPRSPDLEWRAKARWALQRTAAELATLSPVITARRGPVPGARPPLPDAREHALALLRATRARLHRTLGPAAHLFPPRVSSQRG